MSPESLKPANASLEIHFIVHQMLRQAEFPMAVDAIQSLLRKKCVYLAEWDIRGILRTLINKRLVKTGLLRGHKSSVYWVSRGCKCPKATLRRLIIQPGDL